MNLIKSFRPKFSEKKTRAIFLQNFSTTPLSMPPVSVACITPTLAGGCYLSSGTFFFFFFFGWESYSLHLWSTHVAKEPQGQCLVHLLTSNGLTKQLVKQQTSCLSQSHCAKPNKQHTRHPPNARQTTKLSSLNVFSEQRATKVQINPTQAISGQKAINVI